MSEKTRDFFISRLVESDSGFFFFKSDTSNEEATVMNFTEFGKVFHAVVYGNSFKNTFLSLLKQFERFRFVL